jgi:hypothetical protein
MAMREIQSTPSLEKGQRQALREERLVYAGYHSIISGVDRQWDYGGFFLPDGSFWRYREPDAVVVVEGERLRVSAVPLTRFNNEVQILDNAKNMFFSTRRFTMPEEGEILFEWEMRARGINTRPHDLYDGFVSAHLLDFATGMAFDFFVSNDTIATVYALLPFPGVPAPPDPEPERAVRPKYFCDFNELSVETAPWQWHRYGISYCKARDEVRFFLDGQEVGHYSEVPCKVEGCILALGLMTEKSLENGRSVSLHGQGLIGEWGPFTITVRQESEQQSERAADQGSGREST